MNISKEIERRLNILEQADKLKSKGLILSEISEITGVNERTIKRWRKAKKESGLKGLAPLSKRPKHLVQPSVLTKTIVRKIEALRNDKRYLYYGKVKIRELLLRKSIDISLSSVGNALKQLMNSNRVTPVRCLTCQKERKIIRKFNGHAKRLPHGHKAQIQIDHMVLNIKGSEIREFCAYSPKYKLSVHQIYKNASSYNAALFLKEVINEMPFKFKDIQVDGGSEFRANFELACQNLKIPLFVLPPSSPNLNAGVERLNRTCQEEFFLRDYNELSNNFYDLRKFVKHKQFVYNNSRLHRSLVVNNRLFSPVEFFNLKRDRCP
jgi:transposase